MGGYIFKIGEEVAVPDQWHPGRWNLMFVASITPSGRIKLKWSPTAERVACELNKDMTVRGCNHLVASPVTDAIREQWRREELIKQICHTDFSRVSTETLTTAIKLLKRKRND